MPGFAQYPSLAGQLVFITGGATGIGAAMVEAFARQGAQVAFIDLDDEAAGTLVEQVESEFGLRPWFQKVDVVDVDALKASIASAIGEHGPLHTLINNVANDTRHSPMETGPAQWRSCLAVNLDASFYAAQCAFESMSKLERGSIINFSSINALLGPANMPGYVTAKAGLIGMTKALASDFGESGIRVNAILPGWVVTDRQLDKWLTPEAEAEWMKHVSLKTRLMPDDVANLAIFLAADESSMITGQSFTIDGGRT
ncbi:MAG: SDR family NAD(P)-dependent oxidoreductase [Halioglobus sp.]